jgi:predicted AlkP superfamily phosphohydrolase/phosphomutase/tetratricopeptide (TPR) repeat protein
MARVPSDERVVRVRRTGSMVLLAPGWHFVLPGLDRLARLPSGPLVVRGEAPLRSREGVDLSASYEITASLPDARLSGFLKSAGGVGDPLALLRTTASAALETWGNGASGEALVLGEGRAEAERAAADRLAAAGFESAQVTFGAVRGPADMLASIATRALHDRIAPTGQKVALIGLDGADWELIDPLMARGELPNLARLKSRGAWGNIKSMNPMLSPLLWTSVATGKPPEEHGILDFLVRDPQTGKPVPVTSRGRKVKALWNILSDASRSSAFIAWWATWPAEQVTGHLVSDRVAYSTFSFTGSSAGESGTTWPPEYIDAIRRQLVDASSISDAELRPFGNATHEEFRRLATIVASARSYHAAALDILKLGQPDLFAPYYQGIDETCHRFAHYMPPKMAMVTQEDYERYKGTVDAYYRFQDRLLGDLLGRLAPDTDIIVLSDHGFRNGTGRPPGDPPYIEGKPGLWHRRYGMLIMAGPAIRAGQLDTSSLLDIAPTVLYLLGMPKGEDMSGRVIEEAIAPGFLQRFPRTSLPSYENLGRPRPSADAVAADSRVDEEMIAKLRSLGYVGGDASGSGATAKEENGPPDGGAGGALVTAHINEATLYLKNKDYRRAEAAVAEALRASPDLITALILKAQIAREQKQYGAAIETSRHIIDLDPAGDRQTYTQLARIYVDSGRVPEGLGVFREMTRQHPGIGEIHAALGTLLLKNGDHPGAEAELLEALHINPALSEPLTELHTLYEKTDKIPSLEGIVRQGLALDDQSVVHHNWMGLIYEWKRDLPHAEQEFRRAMELDPDYAPTMANLGALYGRSGRLEEAVTILTRAVGKDADNMEAWVNLGAAQGRLRHPREAITALETARSKGARSTTLYNALALAYLQDQQKDKAVGYLKDSLAIDPNQKDAKELLRELGPSS